ncbi:Mobile element protein [Fimbriiglobus ruber]|uniref:Mobile element protein n=1 Tax=Fimbriiglobus ruber TaxID=1908690 RepID=A0A225DJD9_9BACT|nr:Mobile element protein [Fimbriiglobus ruber]
MWADVGFATETAATRAAPVFDPVRGIVDAIPAADETAPRKQRHTAQQIFRRLVAEHGYTGSYAPVQRNLKSRRLDRRETFIPLDHRPGARAEADCGHIAVDVPDGRRSVPVLLVTWSDSNAPFAPALPTERTEAILHGLVEAFGFFGCVPAELWWDNPTTVAVHVLAGRARTVHTRYAALAAHFSLTPKFCLPATPREKPRVENRVFDLRRQWATPVPRVPDLAALNAHLRRCGVAARGRTCGGNAETVTARAANAVAARIRAAGFPVVKDRDTFDFTACPSVPRHKILELARGAWVDQHTNTCLIGGERNGEDAPGDGPRTRPRSGRHAGPVRHRGRTRYPVRERPTGTSLDRMRTTLDHLDLLS